MRPGSLPGPACFNPYRVFSSAETPRRDRAPHHHFNVSIPIGFSHQLRRRRHDRLDEAEVRFNPYRVFSSAETLRRSAPTGREEPFQSLSGFLIS